MPVQGKSEGNSPDLLLETSVAAVRGAAAVITDASFSRSALRWEEKGSSDFVTDVDRAAEREITAQIHARFPNATIVGEELSPGDLPSAELSFVVDPLDGTTNFLHGYPHYAVSVAVLVRGKLQAGAVLDVTADELFTATAGGGSFLNGNRISVSDIHDASRALIGTGFPFKQHKLLPRYLAQFDRVMRGTAGVRRAGSAAIDLASVASGRFDGFWELDLAPWDVAAGILLVREAGGVVTSLSGKEAEVNFGGFVAGNRAMHAWLMTIASDSSNPTDSR